MRRITIPASAVLLLLAAGGAAAADPYDAVVPMAARTSACFQARYDAAHLAAHRGQRTTEAKLSLLRDTDGERDFTMRLALRRTDKARPFHVVGYCSHYAVDPDAAAPSPAEQAKQDRKLTCMARGGLGGSAEEGGEFELEIAADRGSLMLRADYGLSGWEGFDQSGASDFVKLGDQDLVFRLKPIDRKSCGELEAKISVE